MTDVARVDRRAFVATMAGLAAARLDARTTQLPPPQPPPVKTVRTGVLEIGCQAPLLAKAGMRAFAVYLRGFGPTRFLDQSAPRLAEQAAIGQDVIDFADALNLPAFVAVGFDWGGRAACVAAALRPDRLRAVVPIGGYSIQNTVAPPATPPQPAAVRRLWYQWYFNTEVGRAGLAANRKGLCELMWHRHRNFNAPGEPRFVEVEKRLAARPPIEVPALVLHGADDGFGTPGPEVTAGERATFPKLVAKRIVAGAGHFLPHEKPEPVAAGVIDVLASL